MSTSPTSSPGVHAELMWQIEGLKSPRNIPIGRSSGHSQLVVTRIYTDTWAIACCITSTRSLCLLRLCLLVCMHASSLLDPIDRRSEQLDRYDAVFLSPHKFIGGPGSPGILLMRENPYLLRPINFLCQGPRWAYFIN
ncbi:hypothetical protein NE237_007745 [Protea cynaroides]|uniref:Aminotransferase class V domain-containing protein n=1 Tax=Protea cynaroides TaxID=273540 RepID=A0A9Q0KQT6_9MAGN|nr:hypothetical protein NE237_007745 [Protea cynaroides]